MKLNGLSAEETRELIPDNLIFLGYRGSISHGMYVPSTEPNSIDDKDLMGCFIGSPSHYLGIKQEKETVEKKYNEWDVVYYEFLKLVRLLCKGNPNVLSILWLDEKFIIKRSHIYDTLRNNRDFFSSKKVYHSFTGYAYGQLHRMTHNACEGYMGEKRKRLVQKFGYDCKNAAHLIRLLKMGIEFLTEGALQVERYDAPMLLEIKRGEWSLERVKKYADELFRLCDEAYIHSHLPSEPLTEHIDKMCIELLKSAI